MVLGEVGIRFQFKQGMGPHLQMRWETQGSPGVVVGNSGFFVRDDGDLWAPLSCIYGVKYPFEVEEER